MPNEWIKCSERMPEFCQQIIVSAPNWAGSIPVWINGVGTAEHQDDYIEGWTHWMPLPEPPKED